MKQILLLTSLICFLGQSILAQDQTEIRKRYPEIGAFGILGGSVHNSNIEDDDISNLNYCCPQFENGSGFAWEAGLFFEYPIIGNFAISLRPSIRDLGGILQFDESLQRVNVNGFPQQGTSRHTLEANLLTAGASIFIDYEPVYLLNVNIGFRMATFLTNEFDYKERIISPSNAIFREEGTKERNLQTGEFEDLNTSLASLELSISYSIPLDKLDKNFITPEFYYSHGLTNVISSADWKINFWGFGVSYRFNLIRNNSIDVSPINPD